MNHTPAKRLLWLVLLFATPVLPQSEAPQFPDPGHPHMSRDQQRELGLKAAAEVYKQMPVLPDSSPETQYIRTLGKKLVATIPDEYSWPFDFHVVAQKDINAFALPGGPMFVNVGTIVAAKDEAQLAGVMAHEMSHVIMQHSAKQQSKSEWTSALAGIAGIAAGATLGGGMGDLAAQGVNFGAQSLMLKYSRGDEAQADHVGAIILYKAGYNPQALADFFKTLESQPSPPQFFSDHPNPGNREAAIQKEIRDWPPEQYAENTPAFQKVQQHAATVKSYTGEEIAQGAKSGLWAKQNAKSGATFSPASGAPMSSRSGAPAESMTTAGAAPTTSSAPPTPAEGVPLESVLPSQKLVNTKLGPIQISRPENWTVTQPHSQSDYITIAPPDGITSQGVGYGVMINATKANGPASIDDVTHALIQELQKSEAVHPISDPDIIDVHGVQGRSVIMTSTSPFLSATGQHQPEQDMLVTVPQKNGVILFFIFAAPQSQFDTFLPTYQAMLNSLRF
jgi:hypothetical protein